MIKQIRVKFSGLEETHEGETSNVRDRKLQPQRSRSFRDNRRVQNWYRGQSSRELTYDYDSDYMESDEFRTAVAAAAFAIASAEERRRSRRKRDGKQPKKRQESDGHEVSVTRSRIKERMPSSSAASNYKMKNKQQQEDDTVPISTPSLLSRKFSELQEKLPQRAAANSPAKTETKPQGSLASASSSDHQPELPATEVDRKRPKLRPQDIKAEVWEKTELERINERYEKLNAKILEWENEKKDKAKKKLSKNKDEQSENKRARALKSYETDMEMIDQIANGARSQAEEKRRKEVIKVKKKADTIKLTGKIPTKTCLCL
ncbi:hypothetical protein QVD17_03508 [Tagetes erecta]|uniref:Remorin C-terminal domain-containing protein n=1 Tax=Tagetes erecta TaxID=13708 RepID=A0AAD8LFV1_TARER|nr:hypothetical protein QVD17_03508 [Tagetes erecta]